MKNINDLIYYTTNFYLDYLSERAVIEDGLTVSKADQIWALNECYTSLICDIIIAGLEDKKVRVWNRDPVNPEYIYVTIEEALKASLDGLLARCTKKVYVNNARAKVNDLSYICNEYVKEVEEA